MSGKYIWEQRNGFFFYGDKSIMKVFVHLLIGAPITKFPSLGQVHLVHCRTNKNMLSSTQHPENRSYWGHKYILWCLYTGLKTVLVDRNVSSDSSHLVVMNMCTCVERSELCR